MEYKLPVNFNQRDIDRTSAKVPRINSSNPPTANDYLTTQLRWVLHPLYGLEEINALLLDFLMDTEDPFAEKWKGWYSWQSRIRKWILKSLWVSAEYFFLDYLMRHPSQSDAATFSHRKWPWLLDHKVKADFLTHMVFHEEDNEKLNSCSFGVQFYYKKTKYWLPVLAAWSIRHKEKAVVAWMKHNDFILERLPEYLQPEIPTFLIVNSELLQKNRNDKRIKGSLFHTAFDQWENSWYDDCGPSWMLEDKFRDQLGDMSYYYQKACFTFINMLKEIQDWVRENKNFSEHQEHERAFSVNTYNKRTKRVVFEFFQKGERNQLFMSVAFRIPLALEERL